MERGASAARPELQAHGSTGLICSALPVEVTPRVTLNDQGLAMASNQLGKSKSNCYDTHNKSDNSQNLRGFAGTGRVSRQDKMANKKSGEQGAAEVNAGVCVRDARGGEVMWLSYPHAAQAAIKGPWSKGSVRT